MATLSRPSGVAVTARYLFIATEGRIRRVDRTSGVIATAAGGARRAEFPDREVSGDGGPATGVNLAPSAIAVDRNGDLWIVERWNHRIRRVEAGTDIITTVAGTGIRGYGSDGPGAAKTHLNHPGGIAFDSSGTLFLSDTGNHRVLRVVRATGDISTAAGVGRRAFFSLERAQDSSALQPADLAAVAVDLDGNLYVADRGSNAIRKMSVATGAGVTIAGREDVLTEHKRLFGGDGGPATLAYFSGPSALALDGRGNLFIADTWNHRIRKIVLQTGIVSTVAGLGTDGFSGDGGLATKSSLSSPTGVAADLAGNFFIANNSWCYKV